MLGLPTKPMRLFLYAALLTSALTLLASAYSLSGQVPQTSQKPGQLPEFEVATIKPVDPRASGLTGIEIDPGGTVRLNRLPLKTMIGAAFDVRYWQIKGGEAWMVNQQYNVVGKPSEDVRKTFPDTHHTWFDIRDERLREMLQSLLRDRFGLVVHRETSIGRVYFLERTSKPMLLHPTETPQTNASSPPSTFGSIGFAGTWVLYNETMSDLAKFASDYVMHCPVLDHTGLSGAFNYRSAPEDWNTYSADQAGSFLRLMNDTGFKLEPAKGPVEMLVVDHAEPPSPN